MSLLEAVKHYLATLDNPSHSLNEKDAAHNALAAAVDAEPAPKAKKEKRVDGDGDAA